MPFEIKQTIPYDYSIDFVTTDDVIGRQKSECLSSKGIQQMRHMGVIKDKLLKTNYRKLLVGVIVYKIK